MNPEIPGPSTDGDGAPAWRGAFWPRPDAGSRRSVAALPFDEIRGTFHHRVRHLPTQATIALALGRFGTDVAPLLAEWRAIWMEGIDVDALAASNEAALANERAARDPDKPPLGGYASRDEAVADARHWAARSAFRRSAALHALAERMPGSTYVPSRDVAQHVVEDATIVTALARAGIPFTASTYGFRPRTYLRDGGPLREVATDGDDAGIRKELDASHASTNPYWASAAFRQAAGRDMVDTRGIDELVMTLLDMRDQGHAKAFVKALRSKRGTWVVDLEGIEGVDAMELRVHRALGASFRSLFSDDPLESGMLVQAFVPFAIEHRFFVVGDRVVASTASDRALSVTDARGRRLHDRVAVLASPASAEGPYDRGDSLARVDRPLVAAMARRARSIVRAMRVENVACDCYVLDMGVSTSGEILPIEVNTLLHAGLYAVDWERVARALARRRLAGGRPSLHARMEESRGSWQAMTESLTSLRRPPDLIDRFLNRVSSKRGRTSESQAAAAADIAIMVSRMQEIIDSRASPSADDD